MKRIIVSLIALAMAAGMAYAQDINEATDLYNNGATQLQLDDKTGALDYFQKAYAMASELGEDGSEIVANCISIIPQLHLSIAKDLIKAADYAAALAKLDETIAVAGEFGDDGIVSSATKLIPQTYKKQGQDAYNAKDYAGAAAAFAKAIELVPTDGAACLLLGQSYEKDNKLAEAEQAYNDAIANGQDKKGKKALMQMYVKKAATELKAKNYKAALADANTSITYGENDKAYRIAGQAAMELGDKQGAINNFNKYLELAPAASDAPTIRQAVEALEKQLKGASKTDEDDE